MGNCNCLVNQENGEEYYSDDNQYKDRPFARAAYQQDYQYEYTRQYEDKEVIQVIQTPTKPDDLYDQPGDHESIKAEVTPIREDSQEEEPMFVQSVKLTDPRQVSKKFLPKAGTRRIEEKAAEGEKPHEIIPARKRPENYFLKHPLVKAKMDNTKSLVRSKPQAIEKPSEELDRDKEYPIIQSNQEALEAKEPEQYQNHNETQSKPNPYKLRPSKTMDNIIIQSVEQVDHLEDLHFISKYIPHAVEDPIVCDFQEEGKSLYIKQTQTFIKPLQYRRRTST